MPLQPIPTTIINTTSRASRFGFMSGLRFLWRHWYIISFIFFLLPTIISSIQVAKETNNYAHPFIEVGLSVINADNQLDKEVNTLREDSIQLTGIKPEVGIWNNVKYYWHLILLYWNIIGLIFLISVPFKIVYHFVKFKGDKAGYDTSTWANIWKSIWITFIFIFFVNLIIVIVGLIDGSLVMSLPADITIYQKAWMIMTQTFPFHGLYNLIAYLISQINI